MKIYFLLVLAFCWQALPAQQRTLDSLLGALNAHPREDTVRLNLLNEITYAYHGIDPGKGMETADQAVLLARKLNRPEKLGNIYTNKGLNYAAKGEDSMALAMYDHALHMHRQFSNPAGMAKVFNNMAIIYVGLSDYVKALEYYERSQQIFLRLKDTIRLAGIFNNIGVVYLYLSDYPGALEYYLRALDLYEQSDDKQGRANALTNIGLVYKNLSQYPKALDYQARALAIYRQTGDRQGMARVFGNTATVYDYQNKPDKALEFYQKALLINQSISDKRGIASDLINIGIVYNGVSDYPKALEYLQNAKRLYEELGDKNSLSIALYQIATAYSEAPANVLATYDISLANRYRRVRGYLERGLQLAMETGAINRQHEGWESLSALYEAQKDFPRALEAYKRSVLLRDSMLNDEKKEEITRRMVRFAYEKKAALMKADLDKKEALAAVEVSRQRSVKRSVMGGTAALVLALFSSFAFYKRRHDAEEKKKEAEFKVLVAETEMKALRSQMNPHFIFNSLNSISDYISRNDIQAASHYLTRFAKVMRLTLENSEQKAIRLSDDLKALELYMQLESLRLDHKFSYEIQIAPDIDTENILVPPLILQPFIENSIWHGIARKQGNGKILIRIEKENNEMIQCIVEDNGVGRCLPPDGQAGEKRSMGLKITRARIDILNKIKKSKAAVELSDLTEGTQVKVKLPLELSF